LSGIVGGGRAIAWTAAWSSHGPHGATSPRTAAFSLAGCTVAMGLNMFVSALLPRTCACSPLRRTRIVGAIAKSLHRMPISIDLQ
jgi:hypothetical protein